MAESGVAAEIDELLRRISSIEVDQLDSSELPGAVLRTEQLVNAIGSLSAMLLDRFEQDGGWAADGALSAAAWAAQRTGSARAGLRSRVRQGAALRQLPPSPTKRVPDACRVHTCRRWRSAFAATPSGPPSTR
jgi:hypothetical protein